MQASWCQTFPYGNIYSFIGIQHSIRLPLFALSFFYSPLVYICALFVFFAIPDVYRPFILFLSHAARFWCLTCILIGRAWLQRCCCELVWRPSGRSTPAAAGAYLCARGRCLSLLRLSIFLCLSHSLLHYYAYLHSFPQHMHPLPFPERTGLLL